MLGDGATRGVKPEQKRVWRLKLSGFGSEAGKFLLIMVGMKLIDEIASDEVLDQAYEWMCDRRKEYSANSELAIRD